MIVGWSVARERNKRLLFAWIPLKTAFAAYFVVTPH